MKDKTKYLLIGIVIGVIIGIAISYMLTTFRIIRPFGFLGNIGNFSRSFNRSA